MTTYRKQPWEWELPYLTEVEKAWAQRYQADVTLRSKVRRARQGGVTWEHIGEALGITRQGAQARFGGDSLFRGGR
jgi:hypothetical protein